MKIVNVEFFNCPNTSTEHGTIISLLLTATENINYSTASIFPKKPILASFQLDFLTLSFISLRFKNHPADTSNLRERDDPSHQHVTVLSNCEQGCCNFAYSSNPSEILVMIQKTLDLTSSISHHPRLLIVSTNLIFCQIKHTCFSAADCSHLPAGMDQRCKNKDDKCVCDYLQVSAKLFFCCCNQPKPNVSWKLF